MMIVTRTALWLAGLAGVATALSVMSTPVNAQARSETYPIKLDFCQPNGPGSTFCLKAHGVVHTTTLGNGDTLVAVNNHNCYSFKYSNQSDDFEACRKTQSTETIKAGEIGVTRWGDRWTYTYGGETCTAETKFHYANGQIQFDRYDETCV